MPAAPPTKPTVSRSRGRALSFEPRIAEAFGAIARERRVQREVAQDAFALAAGIDRSYYGKLERGERQPSLALILRIARALELPAAELISETERRLARRKARAE